MRGTVLYGPRDIRFELGLGAGDVAANKPDLAA
jgi:hypothetical protein